MADFVKLEDWGLQAIVRGSSKSELWSTEVDQNSCFMEIPRDYYDGGHHHHHHQQSLFFNFPGLLDTASSILTDELQELYKPFFSDSYDSSPSSQNISPVSGPDCTAISTSFPVKKGIKEEAEPNHQQYQEVCLKNSDLMDNSSTVTAAAYVPKYKKRKNQQKRVVTQITAAELTSDKWAWRKYGQKPIKGSPYPRSYYRCSSSKGCLARKQVEQSCTDPGIYILTYTGEHCHSQPTRRNALAGTIRHKFGSTPKSSSCTITTPNLAAKSGNSGICSTTSPTQCLDLLPENPLVAEEESDTIQIKKEVHHHHHHHLELPEALFDDDFFSCLNELDGFGSELRDGCSSTGTVVSSSSSYYL